MINNYEIKKINGEDILYLYLDIDYEFSMKDIISKKEDIKFFIKNYIIKNNISFKGKIVSLIIGGVFVGNIILDNYNPNTKSFNINKDIKYVNSEIVNKIEDNSLLKEMKKNKEDKEETKIVTVSKKDVNAKKSVSNTKKTTTKKSTTVSNKTISTKKKVDNNIYISLNRNGKTIKIELEEYIIGVVGAEMPASFHIEALKAQAIISRTYALKARSNGKTLKDNESNQSYKSNSELKKLWGSNYNIYYNKIKKAVNETKGMYLTYNGNYIEAVFHSTSNGKTESSVNVWGNSYPYLVSVESKYDNLNSSFKKTKTITYAELSKKLGFEINIDTEFKILSKTSGDRVSKISIGNKTYTGVKLRSLLGLRSADFSVTKNDNGITFTTRGYGHGVGLSQYGANGYAKNGYSYKDILKHYYKGVTLKKL